jgi:DNA-binding HxlR family transcriptional regulator
MAPRRDYFDGCAAAHGLDLVGERWAMLVVRELLLGPKRFTDLRAGLSQASPNVLSQRLRELEGASVIRKRRLPPPASVSVYELTEWGLELEPVVQALGRWAVRSPTRPESAGIGVDAFVVALRTMFDPVAAVGLTARYHLQFGEQSFVAAVAEGRLDIRHGTDLDADARIAGSPAAIASVAFGDQSLAGAMNSGELEIVGDEVSAAHFLALFPMPTPAPAY